MNPSLGFFTRHTNGNVLFIENCKQARIRNTLLIRWEIGHRKWKRALNVWEIVGGRTVLTTCIQISAHYFEIRMLELPGLRHSRALERGVAIGWKWAPHDETSYANRNHVEGNNREGRKISCSFKVGAMALGDCWKQLSWFYYQYLLVTALYMLEPWERTVFSILFRVKELQAAGQAS